MRVYRSDNNPILSSDWPRTSDDHLLHPPAIEKNFLISPPGSPPIGWEPVREEPPNAAPLADDLIAALRKLEVQSQSQSQSHNKAKSKGKGKGSRRSSREILLEPEDGVGVGVYVEDCDCDDDDDDGDDDMDDDDDIEQDWAYGECSPARLRWRLPATAMPPLPPRIS